MAKEADRLPDDYMYLAAVFDANFRVHDKDLLAVPRTIFWVLSFFYFI
jgi:hypothetical protein